MYDPRNRMIKLGEADNPMTAMYHSICGYQDQGRLVPVGYMSTTTVNRQHALKKALRPYKVRGSESEAGLWLEGSVPVQMVLAPFLRSAQTKHEGAVMDPLIVNHWMEPYTTVSGEIFTNPS